MAAHFEQEYFQSVYRNYHDQNPPRKMNFYRGLLAKHAPARGNRRILDLGCAFGYLLGSMDAGWRKFGMDLSFHALGEARQRVPEASLAQADCTRPPFDATFDAIVAFDVLEHLQEVNRTRDYVLRSLSADGVFVFVVPVYDGPLGPVVHLLDKDPTHVHKQSRDWWLQWARESFDVIEWTGILRYLIRPGWYLHFPSTATRRFAPSIAVVARPKQMKLSNVDTSKSGKRVE